MKILVTGGLGFIGSNFIRYWLKNHPQDHIINLDKITYAANPKSLSDIEKDSRYRFVKGDICDSQIVDPLMAQVDTVVHFAAESHVDRSLDDPEVFLKTNILGTHNLLNLAKKHDIKRFHHVSTDEVYGALPLNTQEKFTLDSKYDPRSPYSASKAASDHLVRSYFHSFGLPITITNCSNNYGPFQSPEKFVPRMITNLIDGQKIPIYGDGLYVRDWLFVDDHCSAIEAVLLKGKVGQTYNVGGLVDDVSNLDVAKTILAVMGKDDSWLTYVPDRPGHDRRYAVDWSYISEKLGWQPKSSFKEGMQKTITWYLENESWWCPLKTEAENFYKKLHQRRSK